MFLKKLGLSLKNYDFSQPPALGIYYQYPPPTKTVLQNICKAMANIPKLYTQVLHLMNKMNLPCPFTDNYPLHSDLLQEKENKEVPVVEGISANKCEIDEVSMSENESEIGSDTERHHGEIIPMKRKRSERKMMKRPKFVKPQAPTVQTNKTGLKPNDVFESAQKEHIQKKIELKISSDLSSIQSAQEMQNKESVLGFELIKAPAKILDKEVDVENQEDSVTDDESTSCITVEQLAANRVSVRGKHVNLVREIFRCNNCSDTSILIKLLVM